MSSACNTGCGAGPGAQAETSIQRRYEKSSAGRARLAKTISISTRGRSGPSKLVVQKIK